MMFSGNATLIVSFGASVAMIFPEGVHDAMKRRFSSRDKFFHYDESSFNITAVRRTAKSSRSILDKSLLICFERWNSCHQLDVQG